MLHPASLLLAWFGFAVVLQCVSHVWLFSLVVASLIVTVAFAARRGFSLLRRSRWLLLSLFVLYLLATPGEYLPGFWGDIGLTREGVQQGGEQIGRLLALLASLALLHQLAGTPGLLAGLYWWLKPVPWRDSTVVRLMLVLEMVEQQRKLNWREWLMPTQTTDALPEQSDYRLAMPSLHLQDKLLMAGMIGAGLAIIYTL
jgi:hypothetical protein